MLDVFVCGDYCPAKFLGMASSVILQTIGSYQVHLGRLTFVLYAMPEQWGNIHHDVDMYFWLRRIPPRASYSF
jgi:hypothetical protein